MAPKRKTPVATMTDQAKVPEPESFPTETPTSAAAPPAVEPSSTDETKQTSGKKQKRASKGPSSYVLFASDFRKTHKEEQKDLSLGEVSKLCGEAWRALPEESKLIWKGKSDEKRKEIEATMPVVEKIAPKPKRPLTSYILFSAEERVRIAKEFPHLKFGEVSKKCGEAWKALSDDQKQIWKSTATTGAV